MRSRLWLLTVGALMTVGQMANAEVYTVAGSELAKVNLYNSSLEIIGTPSFGNVTCLEYSEDGYLYGIDAQYDTLVRIDPQTAESETIGPLGVDFPYGVGDLALDDAGQLWYLAEGELYRIDRVTGNASFECQGASPDLHGLTFLDGRLVTSSGSYMPPNPGCGLEYVGVGSNSIATGPDGRIYWIYITTVPWDPFFIIQRFDPDTGARQELFITRTGLEALAVGPGQLMIPIPALGRAGTVVLIVLTAAAALFLVRRAS